MCAVPTPQIDGDAGVGADGDVGPPCDLSSPWGDIRPVVGVNTDGDELAATLSADERTIVFTRRRTGGIDLRLADRDAADAPFDDSLVVDTGLDLDETRPSLSGDGLRLYFHGWDESFHIFATDRDDRQAAFPRATSLGVPVNSIGQERDPYAMPDGLYFARDGALRRFIDGEGVLPVSNVTGWVEHPTVRGDERELFYAARIDRIPDVWVALRTSDHLVFQESTIAIGLDQDGDGQDLPDWISPDGCRIYFSSDRPGGAGGFDIWEARRTAR
jgi:Tol biopolymer transport system component